MKKFVPRRHACFIDWKESILIWVIGFFIIAALGIFGNDYDLLSDLKVLPMIAVVWASPLALLWLCYKYGCTRGLIIQGEHILYKGLWKKSVDIQSITAIKITRASNNRRYSSLGLLKDENGNQLYSMFLVKIYMPWAMNQKEGQEMKCDVDFSSWGREYIICQLVYDQEVIDHLLRLNPNIVIC